MGKISKSVSGGLGNAISEAMEKMTGTDNRTTEVDQLLNSGVKNQRERKRRTKAEIEADKLASETVETDNNSLFEELIPQEEDNRPEWEKRRHKDFDEFCEWEIQKAHYYNKPEPDFDFRNFYEKGQVIYYIRVFEKLGEKELQKLTLRTVYPRMLVGCLEKGYCQCVGLSQRDMVFETQRDALDCFKAIKVSSKYGVEYDDETGKKKRKSKKQNDSEEDYDDEDNIDVEESNMEETDED